MQYIGTEHPTELTQFSHSRTINYANDTFVSVSSSVHGELAACGYFPGNGARFSPLPTVLSALQRSTCHTSGEQQFPITRVSHRPEDIGLQRVTEHASTKQLFHSVAGKLQNTRQMLRPWTPLSSSILRTR